MPRRAGWVPVVGVATAIAGLLLLRPGSAVPAGGGHARPSRGTRGGERGPADPHNLGHHGDSDRQRNAEHGGNSAASKRIISGYGFWIFLISDIIMFAAFFAAYVVLMGSTAGGPGPRELFDLSNTAIETGCLLLSSFTCGLASIGLRSGRIGWFQGAMAATFVLGAMFIGLEMREFASMVEKGAGPDRSAFLSGFFALVGLHGVHVTIGLLWLLTMMAQVFAKGPRADIQRRVMCFGLFWHALDIVWVALFTVVYLMGMGA